jgi:adenylate cyclase
VGAERVTRRLAAIVAADIAGYSRLIAADEEGTYVALRRHRADLIDPKIQEFGGRVANTAGDSLLVEFPSVVDALRCSIDIQAGMRERNHEVPPTQRIEYRIGVNLGDVIEADGDLLGDGVNVAARLESLAEPGGICLSRAARDQVRDRINVPLEDLGEVAVKNIERPVRVFRVTTDGAAVISSKSRRSGAVSGWLAIAVLTLALIAGGGLWWWKPWVKRVEPVRPDKIAIPLPEKPSIAILPFINLSGDPKQDYFADGFTEDLITNLAQSKDLFVIAPNSTFAYKGRAIKIRQIAEELGVRYVLEGSVRRISKSIRISAQLIDATTGVHVWAKRYDTPLAALFDVQDEVSQEIAGTLLTNIRKADLAKAVQKRPANLSAYDLMLRAQAKYNIPGKKAKLEARELARQAIASDPGYAPAYAVLGNTFNSGYISQWEGPESLDRAYEAARKAVELDPSSSMAQEILGRVLLRRKQHQDAIVAIQKAISLNPNRARNYASLADVLTFANQPTEAIELMKKAMRLDPFYPTQYVMYLGRAYYFARQFDKSLTTFKDCLVRAPRYRTCYMYQAPVYAELGQLANATHAVKTLLDISPNFSINTSVQNHLPFVIDLKAVVDPADA